MSKFRGLEQTLTHKRENRDFFFNWERNRDKYGSSIRGFRNKHAAAICDHGPQNHS